MDIYVNELYPGQSLLTYCVYMLLTLNTCRNPSGAKSVIQTYQCRPTSVNLPVYAFQCTVGLPVQPTSVKLPVYAYQCTVGLPVQTYQYMVQKPKTTHPRIPRRATNMIDSVTLLQPRLESTCSLLPPQLPQQRQQQKQKPIKGTRKNSRIPIRTNITTPIKPSMSCNKRGGKKPEKLSPKGQRVLCKH